MTFVANFIHFPAVQIFENWLSFDKVTESSKVGTFFETQCSCQCDFKVKVIYQGQMIVILQAMENLRLGSRSGMP